MEVNKELTVEEEKVCAPAAGTASVDEKETQAASPAEEKNRRKKGKVIRKVLGTLGIILLVVIAALATMLYSSVKTVMTVEQMDKGIYSISYEKDYKLDKALSANITTEHDSMKFVSDTFFLGVPVKSNDEYVACLAFLTRNEGGEYLRGRRLAYCESDLLAVYTHPEDGYASISMEPLGSVNVGIKDGIEADSAAGRILMLAAPYLCVDGMNEKGLTVAVLDLVPQKIRQDTGKPKISTMIAVRMLLDRAANTDEAVELLSQYDFNSMSKYSQHVYISDAQGHSVIVEWFMNNVIGQNKGYEMHVIENPVCTNFLLCDGETAGKCNRFDTITQRLAEKPVNSPEDAMENLKAASVGWTQWSCVYRNSDFSVDVVLDNQYDKVFHITPDDFQ